MDETMQEVGEAEAWVCDPCRRGDHSSHDNHEGHAKPGDPFWLDAFDCKSQRDRQTQCECRATWPARPA